MKIIAYEVDVNIDLEDFAYRAANGDVIAFGEMLTQFCDYLNTREKEAGFIDRRYFETVFSVMIKSLNDEQLESLHKLLEE